MGQKVNPHGLRVGIIKDWDSKWYAEADFADCLKYFPDKELGVIVEELINNKHLNREDPELIKVIEQMYKKLTDLPVE